MGQINRFILVFLSFFLFSLNVYSLEKVNATFVKCVDGDTAFFKIDGKEEKFRFLAIDTPETVHPKKSVQAYGKEASNYTCDRITNAKKIEIEFEDSNKKDKYDRYLGWIWTDGDLLQEKLIEQGYAKVAYIYGDYEYTNDLCEVQKTALNSKVGIWSNESEEEGYCSSIREEKQETTYLDKIAIVLIITISIIASIKKKNLKKPTK